MALEGNEQETLSIVRELQDIKRLLILTLLRSGTSQGEVASTLNVHQSSISRMFPKGFGNKSTSPRKQK